MKRKIDVIMCLLLILFCISACAVDSESIVPIITAVASATGMMICSLIYRKETR